MGNVLVLNMGMKSIRSIVFSTNGEKLASAARPLESFLNGDMVEQNPVEWWEKAREVITESLRDIGKNSIDAITVTTSSACLICVDNAGNPLGKCIMVSDKRAREESEALARMPDFRAVSRQTGLGADAYLMLPKIMWIKKHESDIFARTYKFCSPNDFFIGRMTGKYVTDGFNAQKYHYDTANGIYPTDLLQELEIAVDTLPEVVRLGTVAGTMQEDVAKYLGLHNNVKVVVTTYDAICSFFGSGVSQEGESSDVSGTVTVFRTFSRKKDLVPNPEIFVTSYPEWNVNIVGGSNNLGGGLIEWVKQCYYQNETYPYEVMEKDAGEAQLGAGGLIFLPYLLGERAPLWNMDARGVFFGLERRHTRKEMTRAVFESTGFIDMDMINAIEKTGVKVSSVRLSGGLARLNLVSQIKADIMGVDVHVLSEFETTSTGAAMLMLIGLGVFSDIRAAAEHFAAVRMIIKPNIKNHEKYKKLFMLYKDTYHSMEDLFIKRRDVVNALYSRHEVVIENL